MYFHLTSRHEDAQDFWEDDQPEHTPCWQFEIPTEGILDWTTDENELNGWIRSAHAAGHTVKKTLLVGTCPT